MSKQREDLPPWTEAEPDEPRIEGLAVELAAADGPADEGSGWPEALWRGLIQAGATRWSIPREVGGEGCSRPLLVQRYARIAEGSLTAAFILSQHDGAVRRLAAAADRPTARMWLDSIVAGRAFATVGISQLTTSKRLGPRALVASPAIPWGYRLDGAMPWVTAAEVADVFVTGALLEDGRQLLVAVPAGRPGVLVRPAFALAALQASRTAEVVLEGTPIEPEDILAGPADELSAQPGMVGTGGLETSALALGQARAALRGLIELAPDRDELAEPVEVLCQTWRDVWSALMAAARGDPGGPAPSQIRAQANALVLRSTQAFLTARRGSGFLRSDPAQRWARQALFFLVWSCPAPIAQAAIRDFAGMCPA
jgi:butyryl-CoA dehydrogenase